MGEGKKKGKKSEERKERLKREKPCCVAGGDATDLFSITNNRQTKATNTNQNCVFFVFF